MAVVLSKREKTIILYTAAVIGGVGIIQFVVTPLVQRNGQLNQEIRALTLKFQRSQKLLARKEYYETQLAAITSPDVNGIKSKDALVLSLRELDRLAIKANIKIVDIRPQAKKTAGGIPIDFRTEGTMDDYTAFLYELEGSLFLLNLAKCQLSVKPNSRGIEGTFSVFMQPTID